MGVQPLAIRRHHRPPPPSVSRSALTRAGAKGGLRRHPHLAVRQRARDRPDRDGVLDPPREAGCERVGREEWRDEEDCEGWQGAPEDRHARWGPYVRSLSLNWVGEWVEEADWEPGRIVLPILRSLKKVYGPISVIVRSLRPPSLPSLTPPILQHFDAHIDTWNGDTYVGAWTDQSKIVRSRRSPLPSADPSWPLPDAWVLLLESSPRRPALQHVLHPRRHPHPSLCTSPLPPLPTQTHSVLNE